MVNIAKAQGILQITLINNTNIKHYTKNKIASNSNTQEQTQNINLTVIPKHRQKTFK